MGNKIPRDIDFEKEFVKEFEGLSRVHTGYKVWDDFITMASCSLSNVFDKRFENEREEMYRKCASHYTKDELEVFAKLLFYVVEALSDNQEQDFLGTLYMRLKLSNGHLGQTFTPYHISELMATVCLAEKLTEEKKDKPIVVSDNCCGGGVMLIAAANVARKSGKVNPQKDMVFYAQDIDSTAALMCYIQLSLLGLKAVVKIGNALSEPMTEGDIEKECVWITPMLAGEAFFDMHRGCEDLSIFLDNIVDADKETDAA